MNSTTPPTADLSDDEIRAAIDIKAKPLGSLGRIETLAAHIARIQGTLAPRAETCALTIFAGDHGMATAGVSAFPQAATRQVVMTFLDGDAAATIFARALGAEVQVVDAGVAGDPIDHPALLDRRIGAGTQNAIEEPAMTADQRAAALEAGEALGRDAAAPVVCLGEMGIGNTSSASLLAAKLTGQPVAMLAGRGTGLDDDGLARKTSLLEQAAGRTPDALPAERALTEYGGFEIAMMTGAMIGAAAARKIVIVDGFIAGAAALCARDLAPGCEANFVYAHRSAEAGHRRMLDALGADPLLALDMRLGEGTGALLAWPLVKAAAAMLREMATFDSARVSGPTAEAPSPQPPAGAA